MWETREGFKWLVARLQFVDVGEEMRDAFEIARLNDITGHVLDHVLKASRYFGDFEALIVGFGIVLEGTDRR